MIPTMTVAMPKIVFVMVSETFEAILNHEKVVFGSDDCDEGGFVRKRPRRQEWTLETPSCLEVRSKLSSQEKRAREFYM